MRREVASVLVAAVVLSGARPAHAQSSSQAPPPPTRSNWEVLASRLEVRQNTNVQKDIAAPAVFTITNPAEGAATYQVGVGALASLVSGAGYDIDALFDYQRNTATDAPQDNLKAGATGYWRLFDLVARGQSPLISARSNVRRDGIKDVQGWQNAIGYTHLFSGRHSLPLPNLPYRMGAASGNRLAWWQLMYVPYAGLEFDTVARAPVAAAEGTATRALLQVNAVLYPAPQLKRNPVEVLLGYAYRADISDTTSETDDHHALFTLGVNWFPVQHATLGEIGFGVSYKNGEDPDQGFAKQAYWQLALKFRLKKPN